MTGTPDQISDEPRWLTHEEREAWMATVGLVSRLPAALDTHMQRAASLTFFEYMVMAMLSEQADSTLQMSELARRTSASLSRLSHVVGRLEKQGLVERRRLGGPGRRTEAVLLDEGLACVESAAPGHVEAVRRLLIDALTSGELAMLRDVGRKLDERLKALDGQSGR